MNWRLELAASPQSIEQARGLFLEYRDSLQVDLCFQGFQAELDSLPGAYAPPRGCLYLALFDAQPVGCVALRPLDEQRCEMKRLFVRPAYRGHGIGRALTTRTISAATALGYRKLVLDTLPSMQAAQALYANLGFEDGSEYTFNPVPGTRFLSRDLTAA